MTARRKRKLPAPPRLHPHPALPEAPEAASRRRRNLLLLAVLAAAALALFLGLERTAPPPPSDYAAPRGENAPDALLEGVHLVTSADAERQWELHAKSARLYQQRDLAVAEGISVEYYRDGKVVSTLTAERGRVRLSKNDVTVEGNVELVAENGARLETEELSWSEEREEIRTDKPVRVQKGLDDVTAVGMVADPELRHVRFIRDVKTRVRDVKQVEDLEKKF